MCVIWLRPVTWGSEKNPYGGDESAASKADAGHETVVAATSRHTLEDELMKGIRPFTSSPHPVAVRRVLLSDGPRPTDRN